MTQEEHYGLTWPGKAAAAASARTCADAVLVDVPEESEPGPDGAPSAHLFVEGDNLDALKLLTPHLAESVDLAYIDPPYNTGSDFVYDDSYALTRRQYRAMSGDRASEEEGRRHSAWLSMMLPRLMVARNLLAPSGVLLISVDHNEVAQLRLVGTEVFGPGSLVGDFTWVSNLKGRQISGVGPARTHESILCFARDPARVGRFTGDAAELRRIMPAVYKSPSYTVEHDARGPYVRKNELHNTNSRFNEVTAPTMVYRIHYQAETGRVRVSDIDDPTTFPGFVTAMPHPNAREGISWHAWRWSRSRVLADHEDLDFRVVDGRLRIWTKVRDVAGTALKDLVIGPSTSTGKAELQELGLKEVFETPKPRVLLETLVGSIAPKNALVLDFFAGSGTTGAAVMALNARDGGTRRFVLVQRAEAVAAGSHAERAGFADVAAIARERLRRDAECLSAATGQGAGRRADGASRALDLGFRLQRVAPRA
ncbi:site-specific DNA-methyltransferase [Schaalia sp. 19OD2882]|uniref:site-specific DNA-methyltransferase n=1 Tax=Schaalia sp. 19OD2882 TaxID=2794089 RepID=UPI001C1ED82C|nr:site-specific DNA-methyltransferase [Schaalia sp. 19OD2882]QWW18860.1 site-specific DNA-methyltransferase [Schaalia sp. 19OD2882]